jgi:hypothetical protein
MRLEVLACGRTLDVVEAFVTVAIESRKDRNVWLGALHRRAASARLSRLCLGRHRRCLWHSRNTGCCRQGADERCNQLVSCG